MMAKYCLFSFGGEDAMGSTATAILPFTLKIGLSGIFSF